jgi:hypothetical protein
MDSVRKFSVEEKAIWWRQSIENGTKTKKDMAEWLDRESPSWSLGERARFRYSYAGVKPKWSAWQ